MKPPPLPHELPCFTTQDEMNEVARAQYVGALGRLLRDIAAKETEQVPPMSEQEHERTWGNQAWRDRWFARELKNIKRRFKK